MSLFAFSFRRLKVGVLGECSGEVRDAFRRLGHDAISCDLKPTRRPGPHIQGDWFEQDWNGFDLLIMHPVCTFLTSSAEWAYGDGPYHQKVKPGTLVGAARRAARDKAVDTAKRMMKFPVDRLVMENPVGCLSSRYRKPDQVIQPYNFGDDASKGTCLWLKGLPLLRATSYFQPRLVADADGKIHKRWGNQTDRGQNRFGPQDGRDELRSNTYPGIADAMALQWGGDCRSLLTDSQTECSEQEPRLVGAEVGLAGKVVVNLRTADAGRDGNGKLVRVDALPLHGSQDGGADVCGGHGSLSKSKRLGLRQIPRRIPQAVGRFVVNAGIAIEAEQFGCLKHRHIGIAEVVRVADAGMRFCGVALDYLFHLFGCQPITQDGGKLRGKQFGGNGCRGHKVPFLYPGTISDISDTSTEIRLINLRQDSTAISGGVL